MSKSAIEELTIAELERKAAAESTSEAVRSDIQREIAERRKLVDAIRENESLEAAKKLNEEFDKAADDVKKSLTDALIEGTVNAGDFIKNYFKNFAIRVLINPVLDAGANIIKQLVLGGGGAGGGIASSLFGGGAGGFSSIGSIAEGAAKFLADPVGVITNAYSVLTSGISETFGNAFASFGDFLANNTGLRDIASIFQDNAVQLGNVATGITTVLAGYSLGKTISGGFSLNGGTGNGTVNTGAVAGAIVGSIVPGLGTALGAAIGSILGGTINRLFGRKRVLGGSGLEGQFSSGGFTGSTFQDVTLKGGLFRSDKSFTQFGAISPDVRKAISDYLGGLNKSLISASRILQSDAEKALRDFAVSGRFYGSLQSILQSVGNQLIRLVLPTIDEFQREGEQLSDTLSRVVQNVAGANQAAILLGQGMQFSADNIQSAIDLIDAGGENLLGQIEQYVAAFVPAGEQAVRQLEIFEEAIRQAGLQSVLSADTTREEFVRLVEGLDLTTEAGQRQLQVLLALAPQLDSIITQRERERAAIEAAKSQVQGYIDLLTGNVPSTLEQLGVQIANITGELASTNDIQVRIALEAQLGDLIFQRYNAEIVMLGQVLSSIQEVFGSINNERAAVQAARDTITNAGPRVMTAAQIRAGINEASVLGSLPTLNNTQVNAATQELARRQANLAIVEAKRSSEIIAKENAIAAAKVTAAALKPTYEKELAEVKVAAQNAINYGLQFDTLSGRSSSSQFAQFGIKRNETTGMFSRDNSYFVANTGEFNRAAQEFFKAQDAYIKGLNAIEAESKKVILTTEAQVEAQRKLVTAQAAEVERLRVRAQEEFVEKIQDFVIDAGKAVVKLSQLREETVRFYEQQAALAQLMIGQANSLRDTVKSIRFADLNPQQQLQSLQQQFSQAFLGASTATGEALAGFGGDINSLIGPILEKAAEVYASGPEFQRIKELVLGQAETVASRLESLSPQNYQQESLELLDTIDTTLELIQENTKSAERLIVEAIDRSKDATLEGLRGVIAAITGEAIPAFRRGGDHIGGPRIVGEGGAELEVSGPSRIYSNRQLGQMLMGNNSRGVEERLDKIVDNSTVQIRVLQAGMQQLTKDNQIIKDELQILRKRAALEAVQ